MQCTYIHLCIVQKAPRLSIFMFQYVVHLCFSYSDYQCVELCVCCLHVCLLTCTCSPFSTLSSSVIRVDCTFALHVPPPLYMQREPRIRPAVLLQHSWQPHHGVRGRGGQRRPSGTGGSTRSLGALPRGRPPGGLLLHRGLL